MTYERIYTGDEINNTTREKKMRPLKQIKLSIPVTKPLPYSDRHLQKMISAFNDEEIAVGLFDRFKNGKYELWREALPDDHGKIWNTSDYGDVVETRHPRTEDFTYVWCDGKLIKGLGTSEKRRKQDYDQPREE